MDERGGGGEVMPQAGQAEATWAEREGEHMKRAMVSPVIVRTPTELFPTQVIIRGVDFSSRIFDEQT